jgi:hypothetical protein
MYTYIPTISVHFPESDALTWAQYNEDLQRMDVAWRSNADKPYEHKEVDFDSFVEFINLIEKRRSAYQGYTEWKNIRKDRFKDRDMRAFEDLWDTLNVYQRETLASFVEAKTDPLWKYEKKYGKKLT